MAKPKPPTRILSRVFDRSTSPVYVVSPDNQIAYANLACAQWVGLELEALISATCVYSSSREQSSDDSQTQIQERVQGLTPAPCLTSQGGSPAGSRELVDSVVFATDEQGNKSWRRATQTPFQDADQKRLGVLVVCSSQTHESPPLLQTSLTTPSQLHDALAAIRTATDQIYSLESLVGQSPFAKRIRRQVQTAIVHDSDLLIVGPVGSGKEHLARTIHATRDSDKTSELIPVHCSIADQKLIQQNIKDIVSTRTPSSNNDWLLLLDVDQLGDSAQHELLGFFQLPNFPLQTIATSSTNLIELSDGGEYSTELAYYLSTLIIELPLLTNRLEDIPLLAQALLERDNKRRERQLGGFSNEVLQQFAEFTWPENIDQLNRIIQLAAQASRSGQIELTDLPDEFRQSLSALRIGTHVETEIDLENYLGQVEKELISRAFKQAKGNKTKAAKLLGINRPKLLRRMQHFLLEAPPSDPDIDELDPSAFEELD